MLSRVLRMDFFDMLPVWVPGFNYSPTSADRHHRFLTEDYWMVGQQVLRNGTPFYVAVFRAHAGFFASTRFPVPSGAVLGHVRVLS